MRFIALVTYRSSYYKSTNNYNANVVGIIASPIGD